MEEEDFFEETGYNDIDEFASAIEEQYEEEREQEVDEKEGW